RVRAESPSVTRKWAFLNHAGNSIHNGFQPEWEIPTGIGRFPEDPARIEGFSALPIEERLDRIMNAVENKGSRP
ncbi:MAG: hypothetical protein ACXVBB_21610, partial [Isosphaeraceae bacterium]